MEVESDFRISGASPGREKIGEVPADGMHWMEVSRETFDSDDAAHGWTLVAPASMPAKRLREARARIVDDDAVATYFFAMADGTNTIYGPRESSSQFRDGRRANLNDPEHAQFETTKNSYEMFGGPIGNSLCLVPKVAPSVQYSSTLFDKLGSTAGTAVSFFSEPSTTTNHKFIDTSINITGVTTGYSVDLPIRIIKGTF